MDYKNFDLFNPTEEHKILRETVRKFSIDYLEPQAREYDEKEEFNKDLFKKLANELGLMGVTVSPEYGGAGLDAIAEVIIHEEMSKCDPAFTLSYLAHEVLFINNFFNSSNDEQKKRYLPKVLSGEWMGAMAMTEPEAGTDVLSMRTKAEKKGDYYILNGTKQFITNASEADIFIVYAKTPPYGRKDISSFVVEKNFKGVSIGKKEKKLGMRASNTAQLIFEDAVVPVENLLGEEGQGITHMMRNLEIERLTLAAQSIGIALRCLDEMCNYSINERKAFGKYLIEFGQIQKMIAESYALTHSARSLLYLSAKDWHPLKRSRLYADSAKLISAKVGEFVARNALQVFGGYGYTREYVIERLLRDAILLSIGGGTNEAMQKNICNELKRIYKK